VQPFEAVALGGMMWHSTGLALAVWFCMPRGLDNRAKVIQESRVLRTFLRSVGLIRIGSS